MDEVPGRTAAAEPSAAPPAGPPVGPEVTVVRRSGQGWRVGEDELPDLTSAMVLADLLAAEHPGSPPTSPSPFMAESGQDAAEPADAAAEASRLRVTVAQLEAALVRRVRVEQAIGIISERRRVPPRKAFELLRAQARAAGGRVAELAGQVVDSATNPLVMLPAELARPAPQPRERGKSPRHVRVQE
jgi:ANTAR domain